MDPVRLLMSVETVEGQILQVVRIQQLIILMLLRIVTTVLVLVGGCTYSFALNYNALSTYDDGSCQERIYGCVSPTALNYNVSANTDDGSCVFELLGCTDCSADNYNSAATTDDGSCIAPPNACLGDFSGDGYVSVSDLRWVPCSFRFFV